MRVRVAETLEIGAWPLLGPEASIVRRAVFVREQGIAEADEWDEEDASALHCIVRSPLGPLGTGRLLADGRIGRMAVRAEVRGAGIGGRILLALIAAAAARGHADVNLGAQLAAHDFYARHGFRKDGEEYLEVGIAHVRMWRMVSATPPIDGRIR